MAKVGPPRCEVCNRQLGGHGLPPQGEELCACDPQRMRRLLRRYTLVYFLFACVEVFTLPALFAVVAWVDGDWGTWAFVLAAWAWFSIRIAEMKRRRS